MVDRADLHAGRSGLSAIANGGFYSTACSSSSTDRASRADRYTAYGASDAESMARVSRLHFDHRLRGLRPCLCCRRNVSRARAAAENAGVTIDFLSPSAAAYTVLGHNPAALAWIRPLY